jgi:hypothetical protein
MEWKAAHGKTTKSQRVLLGESIGRNLLERHEEAKDNIKMWGRGNDCEYVNCIEMA